MAFGMTIPGKTSLVACRFSTIVCMIRGICILAMDTGQRRVFVSACDDRKMTNAYFIFCAYYIGDKVTTRARNMHT
jgi:hypothetical protein